MSEILNKKHTTFPGNKGEEIASDDAKKMAKNTEKTAKPRIYISTPRLNAFFRITILNQHVKHRNI